MATLNKVELIGNLSADPETRFTPNGVQVTTLRMATNEVWTGANGEKQTRTEWHRIVAWRKLAEIAQKYMKKGQLIYVEGRLATRRWTDQNGVERFTTEIVARNFQMLGRPKTAEAAPAVEDAEPELTVNDEDVPY